jgi:hypothetical protein
MDAYWPGYGEPGNGVRGGRDLTIDGDRMQVVVSQNFLTDLSLDDSSILVQLAVQPSLSSHCRNSSGV